MKSNQLLPIFVVFFNCWCFAFVFANADVMLEAKAFFDSGLYSQADAIYQNILNDPSLTPWKRSIVTYNRGLVYLRQQDWEKAISQFNLVLSGKNQSLELLRDAYYNNAVAILGLSEGSKNIQVKLLLLEEVLNSIEQSEMYQCKTMNMEGFAKCYPSKKITDLRTLVTDLIEKNQKMDQKKETSKKDPSTILLSMIKMQQEAKRVALNLIQLSNTELTKEQFNEAIAKQKLLQNSWKSFLKSVLEAQTHRYYTNRECQERPWDQVIPLFEEGNMSQRLALDRLEKGALSESIQFQQETLYKWREALIAIEDISETEPTLPISSIQKERLQSLTELYQMDRLPQLPKKVSTTKGKKPW